MRMPFGTSQRETMGSGFLPSEYVSRKAETRANLMAIGLFLLVMAGIAGAFFFTNSQWMELRTQQESITEEYAQQQERIGVLQQLEAQKKAMLEKAEITTALIERVPRSVLMAELITRMPVNVTLAGVKLDSKRLTPAAPASGPANPTVNQRRAGVTGAVNSLVGGTAPIDKQPEKPKVAAPEFEYTLTLDGVARTNNDIADYLTSLQDCDLLDTVDLVYIKPVRIDDTELREFQIVSMLRKDADARESTVGTEASPQAGAQPGVPAPAVGSMLQAATARGAQPGRSGPSVLDRPGAPDPESAATAVPRAPSTSASGG